MVNTPGTPGSHGGPVADPQRIISVLNDLIATCRDGETGFREAADGLKDQATNALFLDYSRQRQAQCEELVTQVRKLDGDPEEGGHISATLRRGWLNLKISLAGPDDQAIIDEAERSEDLAMAAYREALREHLPADLRQLVERQYAQVRQVHERVRTMKHAGHSGRTVNQSLV